VLLGPHELQRSEQCKQPALVVLQVTPRNQIAPQIRPFHLDILVHLLASIPQLAETVETAYDSDVPDTGRARIVAAAAVCQQFVGICPRTKVGPRNEVRASFVNHLGLLRHFCTEFPSALPQSSWRGYRKDKTSGGVINSVDGRFETGAGGREFAGAQIPGVQRVRTA
jgi:hypothetical protein